MSKDLDDELTPEERERQAARAAAKQAAWQGYRAYKDDMSQRRRSFTQGGWTFRKAIMLGVVGILVLMVLQQLKADGIWEGLGHGFGL